MNINSENVSELLRALIPKRKPRSCFMSAVILCAGSGKRMGGDKTKQMMMLQNKPVIVHTLQTFDLCDFIDEIVIVAKEDEIEEYNHFICDYNLKKVTKVVVGGKTRQESAFFGLQNISDKATHIAIHDGARCLVTDDIIKAVCSMAVRHGAATAACPSFDTPKIVNIHKMTDLTQSVARDKLWLMQTPQVFKSDLYRAAAYIARENGFEATDDVSLIENIGFSCRVVDCGRENLKITTPVDLIIAEAILEKRQKEAENK